MIEFAPPRQLNRCALSEVKLIRIIIGALGGVVFSALLGGAVFGLSTYTIGKPTFGWALMIAMAGSLYCSLGGLALGLVIGATGLQPFHGMLLGAALSVMFVIYLVLAGAQSYSASATAIFTVAFISVGALTGFLTAMVTSTTMRWITSKRSVS